MVTLMEVWLSYRFYLCLGSTLSYICDLCCSKYIYISVCVCNNNDAHYSLLRLYRPQPCWMDVWHFFQIGSNVSGRIQHSGWQETTALFMR